MNPPSGLSLCPMALPMQAAGRWVLELPKSSRTALVHEDEPVGAGQRQQVRKKVVVGARTAMQHDQWGSLSYLRVVQEQAVNIEAFLDGIDVARIRPRCGRGMFRSLQE